MQTPGALKPLGCVPRSEVELMLDNCSRGGYSVVRLCSPCRKRGEAGVRGWQVRAGKGLGGPCVDATSNTRLFKVCSVKAVHEPWCSASPRYDLPIVWRHCGRAAQRAPYYTVSDSQRHLLHCEPASTVPLEPGAALPMCAKLHSHQTNIVLSGLQSEPSSPTLHHRPPPPPAPQVNHLLWTRCAPAWS